ncbi:MAG: M56 family metallopeptidase [Oscillospiraceae bacterium]
MITNLFISFLNMSISASFVALLLIVWRGLTKKIIPYKFYYLLWGTLFFRLMFPFSFQSAISALNIISNLSKSSVGGSYIVTMEYVDALQAQEVAAYNQNNPLDFIAVLWLGIAVFLIGYWLRMYFLAKKALSYSILNKSDINEKVKQTLAVKRSFSVYTSNKILSPVIIGFLTPKIILPQNIKLSDKEKECVLAHEMVHIKRFDQFIKATMFFISAFHWYNPLVWLCFYLFNEDIETSCDQEVLNHYGMSYKKDYATALVDCSDKNNNFKMGYLAFAQSKVFSRVNNVLAYKHLSAFKILLFSAVTLFISLSVSANPVLEKNYTYIPKTVYVNSENRNNIKSFANAFIQDLNTGNTENILKKSTADCNYFSPIYVPFHESLDTGIENIFYTSKNSAVIYLKLNSPHSIFPKAESLLVLEVDYKNIMNGLYAQSLQGYSEYENIHKVDDKNEAVMLCQKMIKYGLTSGENSLENAEKIAQFCMDIAYERQKSKSTQISGDTVQAIATEFFEITDYTNLQNTSYYNVQNNSYLYDKSLGQYFEYQITNLKKTQEGAVVIAEFYKDPLQTQKEKTVKYTFKKVK